MKSLVTGGAGFIGSNLVDALVARGDTVVALDDLSTGKRANVAGAIEKGAELVEADVRDARAVREIVGRVGPGRIFHLAARTNVRKSVADPTGDAMTNVIGSVNMLEAAQAADVKRFVNISTGGAIYGETDDIPTQESHLEQPKSPYGQGKLCAEGYCGMFLRLHGLSTVTTRFANVYGPRQDPALEAGVIAIFCDKALDGERPVIFGDGKQTRDFTYVGDVVAAMIAASESDANGPFNVGRSEETSVLRLVEVLGEHARGDFSPIFESRRLGEVERSALDPTKAAEILGWKAEVDIVEGMRRTMEWQAANRSVAGG